MTLEKCLLQYIATSEIGLDQGAVLSFFDFDFSNDEYHRIIQKLIDDGYIEMCELDCFHIITEKGLQHIDYKLTWDGYRPR